MEKKTPTFRVNLFYSYSHKDQNHRESMEKSLSMLKREGLLATWSDQRILPGQSISHNIEKEMKESDIIVFLISQHFIASDECMKEWEIAKQIGTNKRLSRIPIILTDCAWRDLLAGDDIKALPKDGKPISTFKNKDTAWQEVYDGIKAVINQLRNDFTPKSDFLTEMEKTEFLSQSHIKLQDIFVFPPLSCYISQAKTGQLLEEKILSYEHLLKKKRAIIHGEEMSGKTALGRHLYISSISNSKPVLHIDLNQVTGPPRERIFREMYNRQFNGDYWLWKEQNNRTLILDNLSSDRNSIEFVVFAKDHFDIIIVTLSSDVFNSFFRDEIRLAEFCEIEIGPLTRRCQENLIKKRLTLSGRNEPITDGLIDHVENRINSIIIDNKIVPRYPFYVLSILQTFEGYMPNDLSITSYGHCYYVLILANLIKAGISRRDDDINTCFHFAEHFAYEIYQRSYQGTLSTINFDEFVTEYKKSFIIPESILNRLKDHEYGIIAESGRFKTGYMYFFFLGRFLSKNRDRYKNVVEQMCEDSHISSNYLTLLFIIHHTNDDQIIDDILLRTLCTLEAVPPARLSLEETKRFSVIVEALPKNILSEESVESEREKERNAQDLSDQIESETNETEFEPVNQCYRILKNNEILGQVLSNKYGTLKRSKLEEIVETVADGGLRLVNFFLKDEEEIAQNAHYLREKHPEHDNEKIQRGLQFLSFLWTMINIEKIVSSVNHPEIREIIDKVVRKKETPAFDLIGYFSSLDSAKELKSEVRQELETLLKKHRDPFVKGVLSIRTQHYMNTHQSRTQIEQSVCSLLNIKYTHRPARH